MFNIEPNVSCKTLWLIPARGGSKGIPNKNLKPFCGESLVGRAIQQALECAREKDIVMVTTDSAEIKKEAEKYGIAIPFMRPAELATDNSSTYDAIIHSLEKFREAGEEFDRVVLLQPTSPFRSIEDIEGTLGIWTPEIDMAVSVNLSDSNPYYNLFEENQQGFLCHSKGNGNITRRQDAPKVWEYNGAIYVMTVNSLYKTPMSAFSKVKGYEMPAFRSIDLDTPEDWLLAELLYERQKNEG